MTKMTPPKVEHVLKVVPSDGQCIMGSGHVSVQSHTEDKEIRPLGTFGADHLPRIVDGKSM